MIDEAQQDNEDSGTERIDRPSREHFPFEDRFDTAEKAEKSYLGAERLKKELEEIGERVRDWAHTNDLDKSTGMRERETNVGVEKLKAGESLLGSFWEGDITIRFEGKPDRVGKLAPSYIELSFLAMQRGFKVTAGKETGHNAGSKHAIGEAIDIRTRGKAEDEIERLILEATVRGFKVKDERTHPPGQKVWTGPHLHIEGRGDSGRSGQRANRPPTTNRDMKLP